MTPITASVINAGRELIQLPQRELQAAAPRVLRPPLAQLVGLQSCQAKPSVTTAGLTCGSVGGQPPKIVWESQQWKI